jgi:hypothetical protein
MEPDNELENEVKKKKARQWNMDTKEVAIETYNSIRNKLYPDGKITNKGKFLEFVEKVNIDVKNLIEEEEEK